METWVRINLVSTLVILTSGNLGIGVLRTTRSDFIISASARVRSREVHGGGVEGAEVLEFKGRWEAGGKEGEEQSSVSTLAAF